MAIGGLGYVKPVPMHDGWLGQIVGKVDANLLPPAEPKDRPQVGSTEMLYCLGVAFEHLTLIAPYARGLTRIYLHLAGRGDAQVPCSWKATV